MTKDTLSIHVSTIMALELASNAWVGCLIIIEVPLSLTILNQQFVLAISYLTRKVSI